MPRARRICRPPEHPTVEAFAAAAAPTMATGMAEVRMAGMGSLYSDCTCGLNELSRGETEERRRISVLSSMS